MIKAPFLQQKAVVNDTKTFSSSPKPEKISNTTLPKIKTSSHEETEKEYCYGGYHPVKIHDKLGPNKNYEIIRKLGWGQFSTVWLALGTIDNQYYALKIVKSSSSYREAALDEIKILERVDKTDPSHPGYKHLVKLFDWFYHDGPNGQHVVMAFEVLGESLLSLVSTFHDKEKYKTLNLEQFGKSYGGLPINIVKKISKQMCLALDYLHRVCGLIHTDLKPENVLIEIKDVEKFIAMLYIPDETEGDREAHSPIQHSNPLPSPILRSDSYFNSAASSKSRSKAKSSSSDKSTSSSINYYENYTTSVSAYTASSISPTLNPIVHVPSNLCFVTTSETDSDGEEEEEFSPNKYSDYFELPKGYNLRDDLKKDELEDLESCINIKIADLGNACYYNYHFTNNIQTRQYRSPEIILGARTWGASADVWSLACLIFELITGDFLFNPTNSENFSRDDDHLAQIMELLNPTGDELLALFVRSNCKHWESFFKVYGNELPDDRIEVELRRIKKLKFWSLPDVLIEKYNFNKSDAEEISEFLLPLLKIRPKQRVDLGGWSNHPWLQNHGSDILIEKVLDRQYGSCGKDIKGWYKPYVRPEKLNHRASRS